MNKQGATMKFTADQVWACAAAAQRINEGYFKEQVWTQPANDLTGPMVLVKEANKKLVKQWLREGTSPATELDREHGEVCRNYIKGWLMKELSGKITEFERTALKIAQKDEFTGRDLYDFAVVACLPSSVERDRAHQEIKREVYHSEQLMGETGDTVIGEFTAVKSSFSQMYNKFKISGRMGESFIDFWFSAPIEGSVRIKGKIKNVRGDKTTALNYVKIIG
jgi:hypothetical protein